uniref:(California timema) hypothetical protein n=1 Tax=Timema californicum TaxID=61474 RepID=A0A7R9P409_TIMCA|nr:unnamed protein product [Timema californicum]
MALDCGLCPILNRSMLYKRISVASIVFVTFCVVKVVDKSNLIWLGFVSCRGHPNSSRAAADARQGLRSLL